MFKLKWVGSIFVQFRGLKVMFRVTPKICVLNVDWYNLKLKWMHYHCIDKKLLPIFVLHNINWWSVLVNLTWLNSKLISNLLNATKNPSRGQNITLLFVLFRFCCLHKDSHVLLHPQYVEHHSGYGSDIMFIVLNLNTSKRN